MISENLKLQISNIPNQPGVYKYYDVEGRLLYVGKARDLKKRVYSYFGDKDGISYRIRYMVKQIYSIEYTVVNSEFDALLLENSLIKQFQPKYNIDLKDDKTYPYIVIRNEPFPRIHPTRRKFYKGAEYFGPYASVGVMKSVLDLVNKVFTIRNCSLNLTSQNIEAGKFKTCLNYHIKLCKGPCEGLQTAIDYNENIKQVREVLRGNFGNVIKFLKNKITESSEELKFEEALGYKEKLDALHKFQSKSTIVSPTIESADAFHIYSNEHYAFVSYLKVVSGTIVVTDTLQIKKKLEENDIEILLQGVVSLRDKYKSDSKEIILPFEPEIEIKANAEFYFTVPKAGDKKKLIDLCYKNSFTYFHNKLKSIELNADKRNNTKLLTMAKNDLGLQNIPYHIECFDNSNLQGTNPVSAIVVFKNGVPSKRDYRFFKVKTVTGPDDYATMAEAVYRRYKRLLAEKSQLPQLVIIDGGKGQLGVAYKVLKKLDLADKIDIIGIAKRLEEIYRPGDSIPLSINKKSPTLKLIQRARDEAHNHGVTNHRRIRNKTTLSTELLRFEGIGPATAEKLLREFKSVKLLKEATTEEISRVIGKSKAEKLKNILRGT